uniref:Uncharacterized protein n=1 Tax=Myoviridae sp. ct3wi9 TaxID=2826610 RepID=A0A8S5MWH2_9CAUD|nr:MAG TPA: hypothetical protein [Myoviridae sp. ct3wi9]DAM68664.1 MAG TPA: hypothetical protein [Caudoviricetes sp.]DAU97698.1 MAG TPA: hypothetical protein [Bacteriophage sp.]
MIYSSYLNLFLFIDRRHKCGVSQGYPYLLFSITQCVLFKS